jgi:hypothetical protein
MLPRKAKGRRPVYSGDPHVDKLYAVVMALAGEVSVLRERADTTERVLATRGVLARGDIENYVLDEAALAERDRWRAEFLERLLRVVTEEVHNQDAD